MCREIGMENSTALYYGGSGFLGSSVGEDTEWVDCHRLVVGINVSEPSGAGSGDCLVSGRDLASDSVWRRFVLFPDGWGRRS